MGIFSKLIPSGDSRIFVEAAKRVFADVCASDTHAGQVYRARTDIRDEDWKTIRQQVGELADIKVPATRTLRLRQAYADILEKLTIADFYANLSEEDRGIFAMQIWESTRAEQDPNYLRLLATNFAQCSVLRYILFNGFDGDTKTLEEFRDGFLDSCKSQLAMMLKLAHAKDKGQDLPEDEKESGRTNLILKEALRRGLAGEPIYDENRVSK